MKVQYLIIPEGFFCKIDAEDDLHNAFKLKEEIKEVIKKELDSVYFRRRDDIDFAIGKSRISYEFFENSILKHIKIVNTSKNMSEDIGVIRMRRSFEMLDAGVQYDIVAQVKPVGLNTWEFTIQEFKHYVSFSLFYRAVKLVKTFFRDLFSK